jgi:hypothetical protein
MSIAPPGQFSLLPGGRATQLRYMRLLSGSGIHGEWRMNLFARWAEDIPQTSVLVDGLTHDLARLSVANVEVERVTVVGELS